MSVVDIPFVEFDITPEQLELMCALIQAPENLACLRELLPDGYDKFNIHVARALGLIISVEADCMFYLV